MQEQDKNKVMANTKIKQIRETKSLNPIWTWGLEVWGKRLPYMQKTCDVAEKAILAKKKNCGKSA